MSDLMVVGNYYYSPNVEDKAAELLQLLRDNGYILAKGDGNTYIIELPVDEAE